MDQILFMKKKIRFFTPLPVFAWAMLAACSTSPVAGASSDIGELSAGGAHASSAKSGHGAERALDSSSATFWQADGGDDRRWWYADLGEFSDLTEVEVVWLDESAIESYSVEVSDDAMRWYRVAEEAGGGSGRSDLLEMHRRFVRVQADDVVDGMPVGLRSVTITGRRSAPLAELPTGPETRGWPRPTIPLLPVTVADVDEPVRSLNGIWSFTNRPPRGFWRNDTDTSGWNSVPVPSNLATVLGMEVMDVEGDTTWHPERNVETAFRHQISVPESFRGKRILLRFDAAFNFARVWVNGNLLGNHRGGFTPFYVDATDAVEPGETAWVTVGLTAEHPLADYTHVRGLVADVYLVAMAPDFPSRLQVETAFDENFEDATLRIETGMVFHEHEEAEIVLRLIDMEGREIDLRENSLRLSKENPEGGLEWQVSRPRHWTAEDPYLYTLRAAVKVNGETVQTIERKVGFRDVEIKRNKFYVNGKQVKLRGVNWHQAHPNLGVAVSREHDLESLRILREANVNHIRAAHWPQFEHILEAADELGFYVLQENSIMMVGWQGRGELLDTPGYLDAFMGQFADMVELSRSHPSVISWSTGNESNWGANVRETQRYAHEIDPEKRPTIFSWGHQAPDDGYEIFSHHYPGLGETYSRHNIPVLFDEYAHIYTHSDAWIDYDPAFRDFYGESLRYFWDAIYAADGGLGGAIWHARDKLFIHEDKVWEGFLARWGLLDVWNRPKPELHNVRVAYSPIRIEERTLPASSGPMKIGIENRFHHTNLGQLDVYWSVGDEEGRISGLDVDPMISGGLALPDREWALGEKVTLRFVIEEPDGNRRNVHTHELEIGRAVADFGAYDGPAPRLVGDDEEVVVVGDEFQLRFARATGQLTAWHYRDELVVVGGPHLNLGYDRQLPGRSKPNLADWTLQDFSYKREEDAVNVRIKGEYESSLPVRFDIRIDGAGVMDVVYAVETSPSGYDAIGLAFDVAESADRIAWRRQGLWTSYPEDHIARSEGVAYRYRPGDTVEQFGEWPRHPWSLDEKDFHLYGTDDRGGRGTRDFRASRHGSLFASLLLADSESGFQVIGTEEGSVKATVNANGSVRLDVNSMWSHPGFTGWGGNPYSRQINVAPGYSDQVTVRLVDMDTPSPLVHVSAEDYDATALRELTLDGGRLSESFDPDRRFYRVLVEDAGEQLQLKLKAKGRDTRILVDGRRIGSGTGTIRLDEIRENQTVRIEVEHKEQPIRQSYLLTLNPTQNLALERPVRASDALGGHEGRLLVDGSLSSFWSASNTGERSSPASDEWVVIDLQDPRQIGRWAVYHDPDDTAYRTRDFHLEYSENDSGGPWKVADRVRGNADAITDRKLEEPIEARYVRLRVTKKSAEGAQWPAIRIRQLELYAPEY